MADRKFLTFQSNEEEIALAKMVAKEYGVTPSELFRALLRHARDDKPALTFGSLRTIKPGATPPPTTPAKRRKGE